MKKVQEKVGTALRKVQEEMKQQADKRRKEVEKQKKSDKLMLSTKDLVFKEIPAKKLVDQDIGPYVVATTRHSRTNDLTTSKALQWAIK